MNSSILNRTKTHTLNARRPNTARRVAPARIGRSLVRKWDLLAVAGLLTSSAAYGIYAITQMTGF